MVAQVEPDNLHGQPVLRAEIGDEAGALAIEVLKDDGTFHGSPSR